MNCGGWVVNSLHELCVTTTAAAPTSDRVDKQQNQQPNKNKVHIILKTGGWNTKYAPDVISVKIQCLFLHFLLSATLALTHAYCQGWEDLEM